MISLNPVETPDEPPGTPGATGQTDDGVPAASPSVATLCTATPGAQTPGATISSGGAPGARPPAWRPWCGRARAQDLLCATVIAVSGLYSMAMIPLTPMLIASHPLLLEMLSGSNASVVAAGAFSGSGSKLQLVVVVAAGLPAMMRFDWALWWAGRRWGHRIVERLGRHNARAATRVEAAERRGVRFAGQLVAVAAFLPGGTQTPLYTAAGWLGLPLLPFLIADAIGTAAWISLLTVLGYLLGGDGVAMAHLVSRYALAAVSVSAVTMIAPPAWRAWRHRKRVPVLVETPFVAAADALPTGDN